MADLQFAALPATSGATYNVNIQLVDLVTGLYPNLTGYSGDLQVRAQSGSAIILEASTTNALMTLNAPNSAGGNAGGTGNVNVIFPFSLISAPGSYQYELKLTDSSGNVSKPLGGAFVVNQTITP